MRDSKSLNFAKQLRRDLTPAEARLWYNLRAKRFAGVKFRRQTVIGPYIADFTCRTAMLVIEVDGDTHGSAIQYDAERTAFLEQQGWRVLRFTNADVLQNLEAVLSTIAQRLPPLPDLDESHVPLIDP
ncbi:MULTISPECIES: endonuclease domain-containing protein [unclassified Sphingobium]|uniref:endonuclease domain-containing protein n=1 Tax=unclassified Sphingobium TaxID=2611147 RepID=UPI00191969D8|nr:MULTISPECIES: endonuclease domain-containing protein [unclassified Sphingobium]CAD7337425.1 putative protein [Sphingobium sp. S6]CAD7339433.1 putative protein [Sphingobium sp. S8]